jgi:hypothetical protein
MNKFLKHRNQKGQALVEFTLGFLLLLFMTFATFEVARYSSLALRVASSVREAARLIIMEEIEPNPSDSRAANIAAIQASLVADVYPAIQDMIAPADLMSKGRVWVTYLVRRDPGTPVTVASNPASANDDFIEVEYQFSFPPSAALGERSTWVSSFGAPNTTTPNKVDLTRIPLDTLRVGERTVVVEIYHKTELILSDKVNTESGAFRLFKSTNLDRVYDMAMF